MATTDGGNAHLIDEGLVAVSDAFKEMTGRRPSPGTVWRWLKKGRLGKDGERHKLEAILVMNRLHTSQQAIRRWFNAIYAVPAEDSRERPERLKSDLHTAGLI